MIVDFNKLVGEPEGEKEEDRDAWDGIDAIGNQEPNERHLENAGNDEDRATNARQEARSQQDLDAVLVKVSLDLLALLWLDHPAFHPADVEQPRAAEPADEIQHAI